MKSEAPPDVEERRSGYEEKGTAVVDCSMRGTLGEDGKTDC